MKKKSIIALSGIITLLIIAFSCENGASIGVDCNECYYPEPDSADLVIYFTINSENPYVPMKLYRGDVEDNELDWVDTVYTKEYHLYSKIGQTYSVQAKYKSGSKTVIAIDGDKLSSSLVTDVCDGDCYIIKGGVLDVRLKEE